MRISIKSLIIICSLTCCPLVYANETEDDTMADQITKQIDKATNNIKYLGDKLTVIKKALQKLLEKDIQKKLNKTDNGQYSRTQSALNQLNQDLNQHKQAQETLLQRLRDEGAQALTDQSKFQQTIFFLNAEYSSQMTSYNALINGGKYVLAPLSNDVKNKKQNQPKRKRSKSIFDKFKKKQ